MSLMLTEAIIDDTDLCLTKFHSTEAILSDQSLSDDNYSDNEIIVSIDESTSEEMELMKSFGLPIGFTSRSANVKTNKKKKKKNKPKFIPMNGSSSDSEDINQLFEEYWTQSGEQKIEESLDQFYISSEVKDSEEDGNNVPKEDLWAEMWQKHWFEVYNMAYIKFVEDFHRKSIEKQNPFEDKFEFLPKMLTNCKLIEECVDGNDGNNDKQQTHDNNSSEPTNSNRSCKSLSSGCSSFNSSVANDRNGSDSDGPPEEKPIRIKRQHESDSIDWSEENLDEKQTEVTSEPKEVLKYRKKKKSKYWHQRYRLFSRFDEGIKLDNESWYSVTPERIAQHIAKRFSQKGYFVIIDAFCGSGGNTIQFASISPFIKVIAIDIDERKIGFAKHNAKIYGVDHRIEFIVADYMLFARSVSFKADAVFLSPPWGGPKYLKEKNYTLNMMTPNGVDVFQLTNTYITPNIGFLLPRNIDTNQLRQLAGEGKSVEVEQNLVNCKLKTVTAYFGDLIH